MGGVLPVAARDVKRDEVRNTLRDELRHALRDVQRRSYDVAAHGVARHLCT
jgi:hypothetical protein